MKKPQYNPLISSVTNFKRGIEIGREEARKVIISAYRVLQNNKWMLSQNRSKNDRKMLLRDISQREDELGLIYSELFNCSYNKAIEELKSQDKQ